MARNPSDHLCTVISGQLADVLPSGVGPWQYLGEEDLGLSIGCYLAIPGSRGL